MASQPAQALRATSRETDRPTPRADAPAAAGAEDFGRLYRLHYPAIQRYVRRRLGDAHAVEDVVAETFQTALEHLGRYEHRGLPFRAWLYRLATSRVARHLRRARPRAPLEEVAGDGPADEEADRAVVRAALASLPARWQSVLALHHVEGLPVEEVARAGLPRGDREVAPAPRPRRAARRARAPGVDAVRPHADPVDAALALLRADDRLTMPARPAPRAVRSPRRRPWLPALVLVAGAGAAAAAGELERLRAWWYTIAVDGRSVSGVVADDGERVATFTTDDGCRVTVRVHRAAAETGIDVTQQGPGRRDRDVEVLRRGSRPAETGLPRAALAGAARLHAWTSADGRTLELFLADDAAGTGSRLLLHDAASDGPRPVAVVARSARPLTGAGGRVEVVEDRRGGVTVLLDDGLGGVFETRLNAPPPRNTEYVSPDGRVRVRIDDGRRGDARGLP